VKPPSFSYARAESVDHAVTLLASYGEDAKVLAGGQSLLPMLNLRLSRPSVLVDIGRIPGLAAVRGAQSTTDGTHVGALATHHAMERLAADPRPGVRALGEAAKLIGHYPIRLRGSVGGSLAHADSTAEWGLMALATDAVLTVESPRGAREQPVDGFFTGVFSTTLEPDEVVTSVRFRRAGAATRLEEYARRRGDFALVAVAASVVLEKACCVSARIALGGVAGTPLRIEAAERVLTGAPATGRAWAQAVREAAYTCVREINPGSDTHACAAYRQRLAEVLVARSLRRAVDRAWVPVGPGAG
jgi:aerobic carbon-monoxide dehydrogenase medium subunit